MQRVVADTIILPVDIPTSPMSSQYASFRLRSLCQLHLAGLAQPRSPPNLPIIVPSPAATALHRLMPRLIHSQPVALPTLSSANRQGRGLARPYCDERQGRVEEQPLKNIVAVPSSSRENRAPGRRICAKMELTLEVWRKYSNGHENTA